MSKVGDHASKGFVRVWHMSGDEVEVVVDNRSDGMVAPKVATYTIEEAEALRDALTELLG